MMCLNRITQYICNESKLYKIRNKAATKIQAMARGKIARMQQQQATSKIDNLCEDILREINLFLPPKDRMNSARVSHGFSDPLPKPNDIQNNQSTRIQSLARGYITRRRAQLPPISDGLRSILSAKSGKVQRSLDIADTIPDGYYGFFDKSHFLEKISEIVCKKGDIQRALDITDTIPDGRSRNISLSKISKIVLNKGDIKRALDIADKMPDKIEAGGFTSGNSYKESILRKLDYISLNLS